MKHLVCGRRAKNKEEQKGWDSKENKEMSRKKGRERERQKVWHRKE